MGIPAAEAVPLQFCAQGAREEVAMGNQDKDTERLRHLRERQIQVRDPQKKQRKIQGRVAGQYQKRRNYTVSDGIADLPHKWKGLIIGAIIGLLAAILISLFVTATWGFWLGIFAMIIAPLLGFLFGMSFDWRDDLRDF
jgi:uncharacterized membrane protein